VRVNIFLGSGAGLAVVGLIGLFLIFPNFMASSGQDFVDQIDTSKGIEEYDDYNVGDTVTIVDTIARIELNGAQTNIWLESIGKSQNDPPFTFGSDLTSDYGVGSQVIITFEVVKDSTGDYAPAGYENGGSGLSSDSISGRLSTTTEYLFVLLIVGGIGSLGYGAYVAFVPSKVSTISDDGWGAPAAPPAPIAPPAAVAPPAAPPAPVAPPSPAGVPQAEPMPLAPPPPVAAPPEPTSMTITVPPGVVPGQVLTVTMPTGQSVNVQVPAGCPPGSQFTITVKQ
tara:strand:- start:13 stop:861 length:849 start_codon:yes stop_codon:yes gene_type:complete